MTVYLVSVQKDLEAAKNTIFSTAENANAFVKDRIEYLKVELTNNAPDEAKVVHVYDGYDVVVNSQQYSAYVKVEQLEVTDFKFV